MSMRSPNGFIRPGYDPLEVADAPTGVTPAAGNQSASVDFTPPANVGGSAVSEYYAVVQPGGITGTSVTPPVAVSGLTNGTEYTTKVWANNSYGPSPYSAESSGFTPSPDYVEDVFSTYLYTGNGSTQTITNNIDLDGEGGLVWLKQRSGVATSHTLMDTDRGTSVFLKTNSTDGNSAYSILSSFNTNGFTIGQGAVNNASGQTYASWTFRKAPKFFDVVTYTGNGVAGRTVAHNLGSVPGCFIVKAISGTYGSSGNWLMYHRSTGATTYMILNLTNGVSSPTSITWNNTAPTDSVFSLGTSAYVNDPTTTYVAYLFAHDAGGFGDDGEQSIISCGVASYPVSGDVEVNLGWEPQWVLMKDANHSGQPWWIMDTMRGWDAQKTGGTLSSSTGGNLQGLFADSANAESAYEYGGLTSTGFKLPSNNNYGDGNTNYIYIAIRRGPMKTPTSGTEVFDTYTASSTSTNQVLGSVPHDLVWAKQRTETNNSFLWDRMRGNQRLITESTAAEDSTIYVGFDQSNGTRVTSGIGSNPIYELFRRAPGFHDVVAYTGTGVARTVNHNLGVAPELMIIKSRNNSRDWRVYYGDNTESLVLNTTAAQVTSPAFWNNTTPTSTVFTLGTDVDVNYSNFTYIAYLFATVAGVSKVGSYTGTAANLNVDCGFSAGARFVLIRKLGSSADWYVWDSARGIVAGNDPYLRLNSTAAEVTSTDYIDPLSSGFTVTSSAPAALNASGSTYIFLAIA